MHSVSAMKIIARGTVVASRDKTDMASCCFPSICVLESGRWLAGFRAGPAKASRTQYALLTYSDDQGGTWRQPYEPLAPVRYAGWPGCWRAVALTPLGGDRVLGTFCWDDIKSPFRPMFNEGTEGLTDMKLFTAVSRDGGRSFSRPRLIAAKPFAKVPTPLTGASILLPDGRWAASFEVNKPYYEQKPWQHRSALTFSKDQGKTWGDTVVVHTDPRRRIFCWDQRVSLLPDGRLLDVFWTFDKKKAAYLNMHARASSDFGRTWGKLWDIGVPGQPARPVGLPDGRIVLFYVDRTATPMIKARISQDGGKTWPAATETIIHAPPLRKQSGKKGTMQDAWAEMSKFSLGLPDAVLIPGTDGEVLAVYYSGPDTDHTDVRWARIRP